MDLDFLSDWFGDVDFNPVAAVVALVFMFVLVWAFFKSPDQDKLNALIPLAWRIIALPLSLVFGYWFANKLLNR